LSSKKFITILDFFHNNLKAKVKTHKIRIFNRNQIE
jgi:hypothetical protein